jgi:hypothetical protein
MIPSPPISRLATSHGEVGHPGKTPADPRASPPR